MRVRETRYPRAIKKRSVLVEPLKRFHLKTPKQVSAVCKLKRHKLKDGLFELLKPLENLQKK